MNCKNLLLCCILIVLSLFSCKKENTKVAAFTFNGMGTVLNVIYRGDKDKELEEMLKSDIELIEGYFSYFNEESILSIINREAFEKEVEIPEEVCSLIALSIEMSEVTEGKFDITYIAKGKLWDKNKKRAPTTEELDELNELVGTQNIILDCNQGTVKFLKKGVLIDLGGIAKGYAIKRAGEILKRKEINDFIINYGGDIFVCGSRGDRPWNIGVKDPDTGGKVLKKIVPEAQSCLGIATSGNYERFSVLEGKVYSHIIDPESGIPANSAKSVTVIEKDPVIADAFATAVSASNLDEKLIKKIVDKFSAKIYTLSESDSEWKEYGADK